MQREGFQGDIRLHCALITMYMYQHALIDCVNGISEENKDRVRKQGKKSSYREANKKTDISGTVSTNLNCLNKCVCVCV